MSDFWVGTLAWIILISVALFVRWLTCSICGRTFWGDLKDPEKFQRKIYKEIKREHKYKDE